uniref:Uncharacterized protein n=1 Tax=Chenopodium quinoa TaxID=63459 RepID=A0A803N6P0_CHEQI
MAIKSPGQVVSLDLFRELLIAISQSEPEKLFSSRSLYEHCKGLNGANKVRDEDITEELRSKLISISCELSADNIIPPSMGMQEV